MSNPRTAREISSIFTETNKIITELALDRLNEPEMSDGEWETYWRPTLLALTKETREIIALTQKVTPFSVLKKSQLSLSSFGSSGTALAEVRILPEDSHIEKSGRRTVAQQRQDPDNTHISYSGADITIEAFRGNQTRGDWYIPGHLTIRLGVHNSFEMDAFREIYRNWRGVIEMLIEDLEIDLVDLSNHAEVRAVRSKDPLAKLDVIVHSKEVIDDINCGFYLQFYWHHRTNAEAAFKAFQAFAIIWDCILKATHSPRSKKRHLHEAWTKLAASRLAV